MWWGQLGQRETETLSAGLHGLPKRLPLGGVFGAPSFFVDGVMHFGQDRLWMVAEDLGTSIHAALEAA